MNKQWSQDSKPGCFFWNGKLNYLKRRKIKDIKTRKGLWAEGKRLRASACCQNIGKTVKKQIPRFLVLWVYINFYLWPAVWQAPMPLLFPAESLPIPLLSGLISLYKHICQVKISQFCLDFIFPFLS